MADERPLPYGWTKEWDDNYQAFYYVDTKADPHRSIWVHPYEDEQYLNEHPDLREKVKVSHARDSTIDPPGSEERPRPSSSGAASSRHNATSSVATARDERGKSKERNFLGKLKDKAIGTKEEREAAREEELRRDEERRRRFLEQQRQQLAYAQQHPQQYYGPSNRFGGGGFPQQGMYGPPGFAPPRRGGFGGGMGGMGMGMPLMGGLAGGMLLGGALDGGGDYGGGDFGGGGGDFGGGGGDFGGGGGDFGGGGD